MSGFAVLFTGLSASGKSTLADAVRRMLEPKLRRPVHMLDGDVLRRELSADLGFSRADREEQLRRAGASAAKIIHGGGVVLCSLIAPFDSGRKVFRQNVEQYGGFVLVHVSTPLGICEARDPKGLYAKARAGSLPHFTGVSDPYEPPTDAELTIDTAALQIEQAGQLVMTYLEAQGLVESVSQPV